MLLHWRSLLIFRVTIVGRPQAHKRLRWRNCDIAPRLSSTPPSRRKLSQWKLVLNYRVLLRASRLLSAPKLANSHSEGVSPSTVSRLLSVPQIDKLSRRRSICIYRVMVIKRSQIGKFSLCCTFIMKMELTRQP